MKELPKYAGIVIVQHIPPVFSKMFADGLNETTGFKVKEAEDRDIIKPGHVYVAPGISYDPKLEVYTELTVLGRQGQQSQALLLTFCLSRLQDVQGAPIG